MSSRWVDAEGNPWRFSRTSGWQILINGVWTVEPLPPYGLRRTDVVTTPGVVVVETMGPPGATGATGPRGPQGFSGDTAVAEVLPAELQDGVNDTFTLTATADLSQAFQVFRNGLLEVQGHGYEVTATTVTFTTPPLDSDVLTVVYQKAQ